MKRTFLIFLVLAASIATARGESDAMYVKVAKAMVINYGEPSLSRLRYLKVGVDVRVESADIFFLEISSQITIRSTPSRSAR